MKKELEGKANGVMEKLLEWNKRHEKSDMTQIEEIVLALREEVGMVFVAKQIESQEADAPVAQY